MDFIGKVCPYCKTEFKEGDDIVVCSVCEMPHHKECWIENNGCTTFGCTGTIMGTDQYNEGLNERLYCKKCGAVYVKGQEICTSCGTRLSENSGQEETSFNNNYGQYSEFYTGQNLDDIRMFVGANADYYMYKFLKLKSKHRKIGWNWCSALFGAYWYAYRKMYFYAAIYFAAMIFKFFVGETFSGYISLGIIIVSGMFGNYVYMKHVEEYVREADTMEGAMKNSYLVSRGGTSGISIVVIFLLFVFFAVFFGSVLRVHGGAR